MRRGEGNRQGREGKEIGKDRQVKEKGKRKMRRDEKRLIRKGS